MKVERDWTTILVGRGTRSETSDKLRNSREVDYRLSSGRCEDRSRCRDVAHAGGIGKCPWTGATSSNKRLRLQIFAKTDNHEPIIEIIRCQSRALEITALDEA